MMQLFIEHTVAAKLTRSPDPPSAPQTPELLMVIDGDVSSLGHFTNY